MSRITPWPISGDDSTTASTNCASTALRRKGEPTRSVHSAFLTNSAEKRQLHVQYFDRPREAVRKRRLLHAKRSIHCNALLQPLRPQARQLVGEVHRVELGVRQRSENLLVGGRHDAAGRHVPLLPHPHHANEPHTQNLKSQHANADHEKRVGNDQLLFVRGAEAGSVRGVLEVAV